MLKLFLSLNVIFLAAGEVIDFGACEGADESICKIKEVRVEPCKEAKRNKPCIFKSGTNATIEFDYVADFDSKRMITQAYSVTSLIDLPLIGMDRDGCKFTECPAKKGADSTYKNSLFLAPAFPLLSYNVKWRLWDAVDSSKDCCFTFRIKLVR